MTIGKVTFSRQNLFRDNPRNIERAATGMRRVVAIVAGLTIIQGSAMVALGIVVLGALLDEVKNFFGTVATEREEQIQDMAQKHEDEKLNQNTDEN